MDIRIKRALKGNWIVDNVNGTQFLEGDMWRPLSKEALGDFIKDIALIPDYTTELEERNCRLEELQERVRTLERQLAETKPRSRNGK